MPVILREGPYRFFFYTADGGEPPHVHVQRERRVGKFWLSPVRLERSGRLPPAEIRRIARSIEEHQARLLEEWDDYFNR